MAGRSRMLRGCATLAGSLLAGAIVAGCSSGSGTERSAATGVRTDAPPFEFVGPMAALGDEGDFVMLDVRPSQVIDPQLDGPVEGSPTAAGAAIRRVDGSWSELPDPPALYAAELVSVGDTVAIVGFDCPDDPCDLGRPAGFVLTDDLASWHELDLGDVEPYKAYDNGLPPYGKGWVAGGGGYWHLADDGSTQFVERPDRDVQVSSLDDTCTAGDHLVSVQLLMAGEEFDPTRGMVMAAQTPLLFDAGHADDGWTEGPTPPAVALGQPRVLCGADDLVLAGRDEELSYSYESARWTEHDAGLPAPLDGNLPTIWSHALDDGSIVLLGRFHGAEAVEAGVDVSPLIVRHPGGSYEVTDITVDDLLVAGNEVFGLTNAESDPMRQPVYRTADIERLDLG